MSRVVSGACPGHVRDVRGVSGVSGVGCLRVWGVRSCVRGGVSIVFGQSRPSSKLFLENFLDLSGWFELVLRYSC